MGMVPILAYLSAKRVTILNAIPELRFSETGQTDPAGRWRIRVEAGDLAIEKKTNVGAAWTTWIRAQTLDADAKTARFFSEGGLVGHLDLQGRPNPPDASWVTEITVIFFEAGTNNVVRTEVLETDNQGNFEIADAADGTYDIGVKNVRSLSERENSVLFEPGVTTMVTFGPLREGDCNNDDVITEADYSILQFYFGQSTPEALAAADFNRDGIVNGLDYALLWMNLQENPIGDLYGYWP